MCRIVEFNPSSASDEWFCELHDVLVACHAEIARREPYRSCVDTRAYLLNPPQSDARWQWIARSPARVVGVAQLSSLRGSGVGHVQIDVRPDARSRGVGRSLLEQVMAHARGAGIGSLIAHHATRRGSRFAARAGFVDGRRDMRAALALTEARLVLVPVAGFVLRSWNGAAPDNLLDSYAVAREAINDAPRVSEDDWEPFDAARVRDLERAVARRGRQIRVTAALDTRRDVVAFTEVRISETPNSLATIEDTAVLPAHRRVGLARWVKTESLRALRTARPDVGWVATTNAEENIAIRNINAALGFRAEWIATTCVRELSQ